MTADLSIAAGKLGWLTKREDLVQAKGKGLLQTWWCEPIRGGGTGSHYTGSVAHTSTTNEEDNQAEVIADVRGEGENETHEKVQQKGEDGDNFSSELRVLENKLKQRIHH